MSGQGAGEGVDDLVDLVDLPEPAAAPELAEVQQRRRNRWQRQSWRAYAVLLAVFALGWGNSVIFDELAYLRGRLAIEGLPVTQHDAVIYVVKTALELILAFGVAFAVCRWLGITRADMGCSWPGSSSDWHREAAGFALAPLGPIVLEFAASASGPVPAHGPWAALTTLLGDAVAGPMEEVLLLALAVALLHAVAGRPWWEVLVMAAVLRWSFHVYYAGQHPSWLEFARTFMMVVWPVAMVLWFRHARRLLGLVIGHSWWDLHLDLADLRIEWDAATWLWMWALTWGAAFLYVTVRAVLVIHRAEKARGMSLSKRFWPQVLLSGHV